MYAGAFVPGVVCLRGPGLSPGSSSPPASKMALLYASSHMHKVLTSEVNRKGLFSINWFLGWPSVHCNSCYHKHSDMHGRLSNNNDHEDKHASNCDHDDDHRDTCYDRTTLQNIMARMEAARYCSSEDTVQHLLNSFSSIQVVNGSELGYPRYKGRYTSPTNNSDHSTTSNDLQPTDHTQQQLQQEPPPTTSVCQGCYEHIADIGTME